MRIRWSLAAVLVVNIFLSSSQTVSAAIFKCAYTEPFLITIYNSAARILTVVHDVEKRRNIIHDVRMSTVANTLELRIKNAVVQRIDLRSRGSDGMSDRVYPYKGEWLPESTQGGCTRAR